MNVLGVGLPDEFPGENNAHGIYINVDTDTQHSPTLSWSINKMRQNRAGHKEISSGDG